MAAGGNDGEKRLPGLIFSHAEYRQSHFFSGPPFLSTRNQHGSARKPKLTWATDQGGAITVTISSARPNLRNLVMTELGVSEKRRIRLDNKFASRPPRTRIDCGGEAQGKSRGNRGKNELFVCAIAGNPAGFGTLRCPVFGRKGHTPKCWARCCKLQADLGLAATHRTEVRHMALLFLFRFVVPHVHHGSARETSGKQDQRPVGIYGQSFGEFLEVLAGSILAAYTDRHLHQYALTAAPSSHMHGYIRDLSHTASLQIQEATIPCGMGLSRTSREAVCEMDTVLPSCVARSARNGACRGRGRSGGGGQSFAPGREAFLPIAKSTRKCGESRTTPGTSSSGNPSTGR